MAEGKIDIKKTEIQDKEGMERTRDRKTFIPRVDIYEDKDALTIVADMPGIDENSVNITLEKDVLSIEGGVAEQMFKDYTLIHTEYGLGDYYRAFTLSEHIDRDRIKAKVKDGVLSITLPKTVPAKAKKIAIQAG